MPVVVKQSGHAIVRSEAHCRSAWTEPDATSLNTCVGYFRSQSRATGHDVINNRRIHVRPGLSRFSCPTENAVGGSFDNICRTVLITVVDEAAREMSRLFDLDNHSTDDVHGPVATQQRRSKTRAIHCHIVAGHLRIAQVLHKFLLESTSEFKEHLVEIRQICGSVRNENRNLECALVRCVQLRCPDSARIG